MTPIADFNPIVYNWVMISCEAIPPQIAAPPESFTTAAGNPPRQRYSHDALSAFNQIRLDRRTNPSWSRSQCYRPLPFSQENPPQPGATLILPYDPAIGMIDLGPVQERDGRVVGAVSSSVSDGSCIQDSDILINAFPENTIGFTSGVVIECTGTPDYQKVADYIARGWNKDTFGPGNRELVQTLKVAQKGSVPEQSVNDTPPQDINTAKSNETDTSQDRESLYLLILGTAAAGGLTTLLLIAGKGSQPVTIYHDDLDRVGEKNNKTNGIKSIGYLPKNFITKDNQQNIAKVIKQLEARGLRTKKVGRCPAASEGAVYAYDENALAELLNRPENKKILREFGISSDPKKFVHYVITEDASYGPRFDVVAKTFEDNTNLLRSDLSPLTRMKIKLRSWILGD